MTAEETQAVKHNIRAYAASMDTLATEGEQTVREIERMAVKTMQLPVPKDAAHEAEYSAFSEEQMNLANRITAHGRLCRQVAQQARELAETL